MKNIIVTALTFLYFIPLVRAQTTSDTPHPMLHPDSMTVYYDSRHHQIPVKGFSDSIAAGHYSFEPELKDGKVMSINLVKVDGGLNAGKPAPDFSVTSIDGKTYKFSQLRGKIVVLNFWFTSCVPCRAEIPELNDLVKKYKSNPDMLFLAITFDKTEKVKEFLKKNRFNYEIAAEQTSLIKDDGIGSYPTNVVIDKAGKVSLLLSSYDPKNISVLEAAIKAISNN